MFCQPPAHERASHTYRAANSPKNAFDPMIVPWLTAGPKNVRTKTDHCTHRCNDITTHAIGQRFGRLRAERRATHCASGRRVLIFAATINAFMHETSFP